MKKRLIDASILVVIFIIAVIVFSYLTNRGNNNITADIGKAELPLISFTFEGYPVNTLSGYSNEMDSASMRDSITPVNGGQLEMNLQAYGNSIDSIHYAVYSIDGKEKLSENTITDAAEKTTLTFDETQLLEERQLIVTLRMDKKEVYYYTRLIVPKDFYMADCLNYIMNFHQNTLAKAEGVGIGTAIEPTDKGDNTTFQHVTINSNYDHVTWGNLAPAVAGSTRLKIVEANTTYTSAVLEYEAICNGEENEKDLYRIQEFYRVRMNGGKMYLLDYDRTMEQVFDPQKNILNEKGIVLGIAPYDLAYMVNDDGTIVSFIQANELWIYNKNTDELSLVFSFMDSESEDVRNLLSNHTIKLLAMDKEGNTSFAVYGYMNRGLHEGEVGAAIYYYNNSKNCIEEKAFIPSDKSAPIAEAQLGRLVYYSVGQDRLYVLLDGTLYEIDMKKGKQSILVEKLSDGQYVVSEDGHLVAYQSNGTLDEATKITVKNLKNGKEHVIEAAEDECIKPLGFIGNDFICGTAKKADAGQTVSGQMAMPMYKLEIWGSDNTMIKTVQSEGVYVLDTKIENGMITINRVVKADNLYSGISADYVTSNEEKKESNISLSSYATELKETQLRLTFADGIQNKEAKLLKPKQVLIEKPQMINFESVNLDGFYYVYGRGELKGIDKKAGYAIQTADAVKGVVVSSEQKYVWVRGNRYLEYTITGKDDVIAHIREQLTAGVSPIDIANNLSDGNALDLTGCTTEQILYNINTGTPIIGMIDGASSIILTGYNQTSVIYTETATGTSNTISYAEMDQLLAGTGRAFIGYID